MGFEERIGGIEQRAREVPLAVLVWGPGEGGGEHYAKRLKVRDEIRHGFANADVRFSEELIDADLPSEALSLPAQAAEAWHLAACDICVVLDTAKGSGEEIAHFSSSPDAHKLLIVTHERYRNAESFPGEIRSRLERVFYNDDEYASCTMVARIIAHIREVAFTRLRIAARW